MTDDYEDRLRRSVQMKETLGRWLVLAALAALVVASIAFGVVREGIIWGWW